MTAAPTVAIRVPVSSLTPRNANPVTVATTAITQTAHSALERPVRGDIACDSSS